MKRQPRLRISWNGGRNGWRSFLVGVSFVPLKVWDDPAGWHFDLYLGLWVLRYTSKAAR